MTTHLVETTPVYLIHEEKKIKKLRLIKEIATFVTICDPETNHIGPVCNSRDELEAYFTKKGYRIQNLNEDEYRICSKCERVTQAGFLFESDGTVYCSENCLTQVISMEEYLAIHNDGDGDAYWTQWEG